MAMLFVKHSHVLLSLAYIYLIINFNAYQSRSKTELDLDILSLLNTHFMIIFIQLILLSLLFLLDSSNFIKIAKFQY